MSLLDNLNEILSELIRPEAYYMDSNTIKELRTKAIKIVHKIHYENNKYYHDLCKTRGVSETIDEKDFHKILIPDEVFKSYPMDFPEDDVPNFVKWLSNVISVPIPEGITSAKDIDDLLRQFDEKGLLLGFSSRTTGRMTFLPRDKLTQDYLVKSYVATVLGNVKLELGKEYFVLAIPRETYLQIGWNGRMVANAISPGNVFFAIDKLDAKIIRIRTGKLKNFKEKSYEKINWYVLTTR